MVFLFEYPSDVENDDDDVSWIRQRQPSHQVRHRSTTMSFSNDNNGVVDEEDFLLAKYDYLDTCIANETFDGSLTNNLVLLLKFLLENGEHLDDRPDRREQLDALFGLFRNLLRNHLRSLPDSINLLILRLIEIRAGRWKIQPTVEEYYARTVDKISNHHHHHQHQQQSNVATPLVKSAAVHRVTSGSGGSHLRMSKSYGDVLNAGPDDFLAPKSQPTARPILKSNSKGVLKDEVLIKNSDSGKVMGIKGRRVHMIEEISDTIISFQKVSPSAKDRLVQITGYTAENIGKAKSLIEATIRQNMSPIPSAVTALEPCCFFDSTTPTTTFDLGSDIFAINSDHHRSESDLKLDRDNGDDYYCWSFTVAGADTEQFSAQIKVSDVAVGKKLKEFMKRYDFLDFFLKNSKPKNQSITTNIITYDRDFLLRIKANATVDQLAVGRIINEIRQKEMSLLRE